MLRVRCEAAACAPVRGGDAGPACGNMCKPCTASKHCAAYPASWCSCTQTSSGWARRVVAASPWLAAAPDLARVRGLGVVDVAAVRLWLDGAVRPRTASNVLAGFDAGVGATVFDLSSLQVARRARPPC